MSTIMEIYTDGSLGTGPTAGLGWVLITDAGPETGFQAITLSTAHATSQHTELQAIKAALKHAISTGFDMRHAVLYTDSADAITLLQAEAKGHGRGRPTLHATRNRELTRWIAIELKVNRIHLRHIKGHNGDPGNEAADRLAVMARRNREYGFDRNHGHAMATTIRADYTSALTLRAGNHWASPAAIRTHRAAGEPLCAACAYELKALEREAS
jgi:ribonuclease HI